MSNDKNQNAFGGGWVLLGSALLGSLAIAGAFLAQAQAPTLQISSPANGSVVRPGQALSVTVTSPNGTAFSQVAVMGPKPIGFQAVATSVPAQFSIPIPADTDSGMHSLIADGITTSGQGATSAPIEIDIERPDLPMSLSSLEPDIILESTDQQRSPVILATFQDGTEINVTGSTLLSFISTNNNVVTVAPGGIVKAGAPGSAAISAIYTSAGKRVQLTMQVEVRQPVLNFSPNALSFPAQVVGTTSSPQTLTFTNVSLTPIKILDLSTTGDFSATHNCPASPPLPVGGTCAANVTFLPRASGSRSGSIAVINSKNGGVPITIALTGTGTPAP